MSKGKLLAFCMVWLVIIGAAAVAYRAIVVPAKERAAVEEYDEQVDQTTGGSRYDHRVNFALDAFSGYAILRSPEFKSELASKRIAINLKDDGADYTKRLKALANGEVQMAAFTIDALIKANADLAGDSPAVIVSIIDETRGADAMVADKNTVPNVDAMNNADTRFVLTSDSPSETLTRVVMAQFRLNRIVDDPFVRTAGPEETVKRFKSSNPGSSNVFVLWEPYVSKILKDQRMHIVVDSSKFRGYIVDVIVVGRSFLADQPKVVQEVLGSYFKVAYDFRKRMPELIASDAKRQKEKLSSDEANRLSQGIRWKNTQENFCHFGLHNDQDLQHIEDMIVNITQVLVQTRAIPSDPLKGQPNRLFFEKPLKQLQQSNFHPGLSSEGIATETINLPSLNDDEWSHLREIGELEVRDLEFSTGTSRLSATSHAKLDELVAMLKTWPTYYVHVKGNASRRGDPEANKKLAGLRAKAAADYLTNKGIDPNRIRAEGVDPSGQSAVSFVLGEAPY